MTLSVHADLRIEIDGRTAQLRGSGRSLRLELETPVLLRDFFRAELPDLHALFGIGAPGGENAARRLPAALAASGLTLEIHDRRGLLLTLGEGAQGQGFTLPLVGRLEHVALAGPGAALRLALNA